MFLDKLLDKKAVNYVAKDVNRPKTSFNIKMGRLRMELGLRKYATMRDTNILCYRRNWNFAEFVALDTLEQVSKYVTDGKLRFNIRTDDIENVQFIVSYAMWELLIPNGIKTVEVNFNGVIKTIHENCFMAILGDDKLDYFSFKLPYQ